MKKKIRCLNYPKNRKPRPIKKDLTGSIFGRLKVIKRLSEYRNGLTFTDAERVIDMFGGAKNEKE